MIKVKNDTFGLVTHPDCSGVLFVRSDFWKEEDKELYQSVKSNYKYIVGLCSYQSFPGPIINPYEYGRPTTKKEDRFIYQYPQDICAWCNCFREDSSHIKHIPSTIPKVLFSESDLINVDKNIEINNDLKKFDLICYIGTQNWNAWVRRIDIARKFINHVTAKGVSVCVVGTYNPRGFENCSIRNFSGQNKFLERLKRSKGLLVCSEYDASPRIITQALCLGVPVMVNKNILGGWKYINETNGLLFDPSGSLSQIDNFVNDCRNGKFKDFIYKPPTDPFKELKCVLNAPWTIDAVLYINLDSSTDRKDRLLNHLYSYGIPESLIVRVSAMEHVLCGHYGCTLSHVKALKIAKKMGLKKVMIIEDDFRFKLPAPRVKDIIAKNKYNVLLLAKGYIQSEPQEGIGRVYGCTTSSGYVLDSDYIPTLKTCFKNSLKKLAEELNDCTNRVYTVKYALDKNWFDLQKKDNWLITNPTIGKQKGTSSDIMKSNPLEPVHVELLQMLDCLKDYNYWLMGGALIGSQRHKNMIPWDGDIDVGMMKSDYELFASNFESTNFYIDEENTIPKIRSRRFKYPCGAYLQLDIFTYVQEINEIFNPTISLQTLNSWTLFDYEANLKIPKNMIFPTLKCKLGSMEVNVPFKTEEYLRLAFGDWRKLPPFMKRNPHEGIARPCL